MLLIIRLVLEYQLCSYLITAGRDGDEWIGEGQSFHQAARDLEMELPKEILVELGILDKIFMKDTKLEEVI